MERVGLCLDPSGVASREGVDHRVNSRTPCQIKIDEGAIFVEQDADQSGRRISIHIGLRVRRWPILGRSRTPELEEVGY